MRLPLRQLPVVGAAAALLTENSSLLDLPLADSSRPLNLGCAMMQTTTHEFYQSFQFRAWAGYLEEGAGSTRPFTSATIRFIALSNFSD